MRKVRNSKAGDEGLRQFLWAKRHMPALKLAMEYVEAHGGRKLLSEVRAGLCLHISKETSVLISYLRLLGMEVEIVSANPLSTKDSVASYLRSIGVNVHGSAFEPVETYASDIKKLAESEPELILDDGGELHTSYSKTGSRSCFGGTDETTSGTVRLLALQRSGLLRYPVIPVNDAKTKHLFDNRYGTGQSSLDGLIRATGLLIAGRAVVISGYGWVGKGVAERARGLGARVIVTEVDPISALEAHLDGYEVKKMREAAHEGDIFLTCTGQVDIIGEAVFELMHDGVILGNCGHFEREIDVAALKRESSSHKKIGTLITEYRIRDRSIFLLCEGRVVNLVAAEGHPPEVMQLSFSDQLLSIFYLARHRQKLSESPTKIIPFPKEIDDLVAHFALRSFRIDIDRLNEEQRNYSESFER